MTADAQTYSKSRRCGASEVCATPPIARLSFAIEVKKGKREKRLPNFQKGRKGTDHSVVGAERNQALLAGDVVKEKVPFET